MPRTAVLPPGLVDPGPGSGLAAPCVRPCQRVIAAARAARAAAKGASTRLGGHGRALCDTGVRLDFVRDDAGGPDFRDPRRAARHRRGVGPARSPLTRAPVSPPRTSAGHGPRTRAPPDWNRARRD